MALVPYPDDADLDPRAREVLERLPVRLNLFAMLANAPAVMAETLRLGSAILTRGELDADLRELAILHVARLTGTEYEWVQHVPIARAVGVSDAQIAGLQRGDVTGEAFPPRAAMVLGVVYQAVREGQPDAEVVQRAAAELGAASLIELLITVGYYGMLGYVMRAVRLDLDEPLDPSALTGG